MPPTDYVVRAKFSVRMRTETHMDIISIIRLVSPQIWLYLFSLFVDRKAMEIFMNNIIAVTGSITSASRLLKYLERAGCIDARVIHTPSEISTGGCSYSVSLPDKYLPVLFTVSSGKKLRIKNIYRYSPGNEGGDYIDIS